MDAFKLLAPYGSVKYLALATKIGPGPSPKAPKQQDKVVK